jgi:phosphoserine phosphatase
MGGGHACGKPSIGRLDVIGRQLRGDRCHSRQLDGGWLREQARRHGLDPAGSAAYGATQEDATLLSGAARPCAVTPDRTLRRLAHEFDWPVVESA